MAAKPMSRPRSSRELRPANRTNGTKTKRLGLMAQNARATPANVSSPLRNENRASPRAASARPTSCPCCTPATSGTEHSNAPNANRRSGHHTANDRANSSITPRQAMTAES